MSKQYDGYELPENPLVKESICFEVRVPNDPAYIQAFKAQIEELSYWWNWQRDNAHTGALCAHRWYPVWAALKPNNCCEDTPPRGVDVGDDFMEFRQDGCKLQTKCSDGSWSTIYDSSLCLPSDQPGDGAHQPQPGGGCETYSGKLQAGGKFLVPALVSTNDTVELTGSSGAGSDNSVTWYCPDGDLFFAGACVPTSSFLSGGDPLPTAPHMSLIFEIAGVFYPTTGGPVTVPMGVVDEQVYIQVNDSAISDNPGSYSVDVAVCNNEAARWTHTLDFSVNPKGFTPHVDSYIGNLDGQWLAGAGFTTTDVELAAANNWYRLTAPERVFSAHITNVTMKFSRHGMATDQTHSNNFTVISDLGGAGTLAQQNFDASLNGDDLTLGWSGDILSAGLLLEVVASYYHPGATFAGDAVIKSVTISGYGPDPFV